MNNIPQKRLILCKNSRRLFFALFMFLTFAFTEMAFSQQQPTMVVRGSINSWGNSTMTYRASLNQTWITTVQATSNNPTSGFLFANNNLYSPKWSRNAGVSFNTQTDWYSNTGDGTFNQVNGRFYTFIIKDVASFTNTRGYLFETSAAPVIVSGVSQSPLVGSVTTGNTVTINATTSANLPTGQGVFLRYSTNNFSTSTVVNMTGADSSYSATIPSGTNTAGANVVYYVFTSGGTTAMNPDDADFATINLNNNTGSNYSYNVISMTPTISSVSAAPNNGILTNAYNGSIITLNGTNLAGVTSVTLSSNPSNPITIPSNVSNTVISFELPTGYSGTVTVTHPSHGSSAPSATSITNVGFISSGSGGNWNVGSSWMGGTAPSASTNLATIASGAPITLSTDIAITNLTINSDGIFTASDSTPRTLTISNGGSLTNNGTFTAGNGTVAFAGSATVSGTITFNNATLAGGVNFGTGSIISGTLTINPGGFVSTNAPTYNSGATLRYNTNGPYGRGTEWSATSGNGYPHHVQISGNTTLNVHNNEDTQRQIAGNLTIDSGSTFTTSSMNVFNQTIGVVILGNVINNGTFTLATSADRVRCVNFNNNTNATTTLSTTAGGDLELTGNLIDNATFNANTRAVFFTGTGIQEISGSGTFAIDYMVVNKASGSVKLLNNLLCEGPNGGNAITLTTPTDILDLNGFTATFGKEGIASNFSGSGLIRGGGNSSLILLGNGNMGILNIDITTPGTTNVLNNLTLDRTISGSVTLGNALIINNALSLTSGTLNMQTNALSGINLTTSGIGKLQTQNTSPTPIPSGRSWSFEVEMNANSNQTVPQGNYATLRLNTGGIKTIADNSAIAGDFVVTSPATATVGTTITFNGSSAQSIAGLAYNNIEFSETGVKTFTSNASVGSTSAVTFTGTPGTIDFDGASNNLIFQLKSVDGGTARIGNTTGWTLNGNVTVERYIPAKRAWRLLTAPLKSSTTNKISANWQGVNGEGLLLFSPATYQSQTMTGYTTGGGMPNIWKYNNAWQAIPDLTGENLFESTVNNAFLVFATGPQASTNIATGQSETTLKPKGNLITGNVAHTLTANQYKLIANPYASPLNTASLAASNSGTTFWMIDPSLNTVGGYYTFNGNNWTPTTPAVSGNDAYIQSGQGFFVRNASAATFTITESHKVIGNSNTWFTKTAPTENTENADKIRVLLYKQINNEWQLADGILAVNTATGNNDLDATDTQKMSNFNENIMFKNGTTNLTMEYRALPQSGQVQPMFLTGTTAQPYQLRVLTEGYSNTTVTPFLQDTTTGTITPIPTDGTILTVPFTGIATTSTSPDQRFKIVYQNVALNSTTFNTLQAVVYPNPVNNGILNIHLASIETAASFTLTNLLGQTVHKGELNAIENSITLPELQQGVYIITIDQEGKKYSTKLQIQN